MIKNEQYTHHVKLKGLFDSYTSAVFVVFLPRPMEGMGWLKFSDLFRELPVPPQAAVVIGPF